MLVYYNECKHCEECKKCGAVHSPHLLCDDCESDVDVLYEMDDSMICHECVSEILQGYSVCSTDEDGNEHECYVVDGNEYLSVDEFESLLEQECLSDYQ